MAKIAYSKLGLNKMVNKDPIIIEFNGHEIEVIQYLPIEKKLDLITSIINKSIDINEYYNPCRVDIFLITEIILAYTNINVTEKQKDDILKFYDSLIESGFADIILENIPAKELNYIKNNSIKTISNIYKYRNSALGIFEAISNDYSNLGSEAADIQQKIADPQNMELLKTVLTKLG